MGAFSNHGTLEPGSPAPVDARPLLIECNRRAEITWLSTEARAAFGEARTLLDAVPAADTAVSLSRVQEWRDSVLLGAQFRNLAEHVAPGEPAGLSRLQDNMLRHCFHLQNVERTLYTRARRKRGSGGGGGRQVLLQVERERQRLGRELHTGVGQMLAAIRMQLEIIDLQIPDPPGPLRQTLDRISTLASGALEQVRAISHRVHPPDWQRLTLVEALRVLWETSGIPERFQASLRIEPLPAEPELDWKVLLFRTAQEAISNLTRHSRATRAEMALTASGGRLILRVEDNGVGFDVSRLLSTASGAAGLGLRSIREQAQGIGGSLLIESSSAGTRLELSVPFPEAAGMIPS